MLLRTIRHHLWFLRMTEAEVFGAGRDGPLKQVPAFHQQAYEDHMGKGTRSMVSFALGILVRYQDQISVAQAFLISTPSSFLSVVTDGIRLHDCEGANRVVRVLRPSHVKRRWGEATRTSNRTGEDQRRLRARLAFPYLLYPRVGARGV